MAPSQCPQCQEIFASKNKCKAHKAQMGHQGSSSFICVECKVPFAKLKALKTHRASSGHNNTKLNFTSAPEKQVESTVNKPPKPPRCVDCDEEFTTFHGLSAHRRSVHNLEASLTLKCSRCAEAIPLGEVHSCGPRERVACLVCGQKFNTPEELGEHLLENVLSCEICGVHLPPGMTLQDHWKVSNQHLYCRMCRNAFENHKAWANHTMDCSLARASLAPGCVGTVTSNKPVQYPPADRKDEKADGSRAFDWEVDVASSELKTCTTPVPASGTEWFLSGLIAREELPDLSEDSSRRSSLSVVSRVSEHVPEGATGPWPGTDKPDIPTDCTTDSQLAEVLHDECTQHNIEQILDLLEDDEERQTEARPNSPKKTRSLLSHPPQSLGESSAYATSDASLAVHHPSLLSSARDDQGRADSPPLLGYRRGARKPAAETDGLFEMASSTRVASWLDGLAQLTLSGQPFLPLPEVAGAARVVPPAQNKIPPEVKPGPEPVAAARAERLSWHCRLCLRQPCEDPVATCCGHVFCRSCILREVATSLGCPACATEFFVRLNPEDSS